MLSKAGIIIGGFIGFTGLSPHNGPSNGIQSLEEIQEKLITRCPGYRVMQIIVPCFICAPVFCGSAPLNAEPHLLAIRTRRMKRGKAAKLRLDGKPNTYNLFRLDLCTQIGHVR